MSGSRSRSKGKRSELDLCRILSAAGCNVTERRALVWRVRSGGQTGEDAE